MVARIAGASAVAVVIVAASLVWARASAPSVVQPSGAGRALYASHCAVCHGEAGRGDGPSASGFATKPTDLTEGRRLNQLPTEYFVNIIRNGGPAEGLSPTMPPFVGHLSDEQTLHVLAWVRSLAVPRFTPELARRIVTVAGAPRQPIFFSHLVHAGSYQIACLYCHPDARRSEYAGIPSVERCMGCHKIIGAQDNPEIRKIHAFSQRNEAIPWVRVYKVPEFTYFPHKPHVGAAGLTCQGCHGAVERMRVVGADVGPSLLNDLQNVLGLRPVARPLTMGWCIDCHREQNAKRGAKAPIDCVACHH
jgi:mono/diheme cytochrome c family protein